MRMKNQPQVKSARGMRKTKGSGVLLTLPSVSGLVRFHIGSEERVDAGLIPGAFCFEPLQYLLIEPDRDRRLGFRQPKDRALEEGLPLFRDIGRINSFILQRINSCPVRPRPLLGSVFLHVCSPFALR